MPILDRGNVQKLSDNGWIIGHMAVKPRKTEDFGVKWMTHVPGPAGDGTWSICLNPNTVTLSVLVSGHFRIHFRESADASEETIDLMTPGDFVLFGPPTQHWSEVIIKSTFLTVRWPSLEEDCGSIEKSPWANHRK